MLQLNVLHSVPYHTMVNDAWNGILAKDSSFNTTYAIRCENQFDKDSNGSTVVYQLAMFF